MKEILYIQAGTQANYIGTHFWNTQESYFTYGDDEEPEISHGISFREGLNQKAEPTFCPRLLAFDYKAQFGTLNQTNALFGAEDDDSNAHQILWNGNAVEYRQEPVGKSQYQIHMDELDSDSSDADAAALQQEDVRYWSDFNRVYYVPRTVQKIPDVAEWEDVEGNWAAGHQTFERYDEDTGLMEGPLRLFLEECETIQGIQLMHDTSTFGSFMNSFLTSLHDEFLKLPLLAWPLLSNPGLSFVNTDAQRETRKIVNDALVLRSLAELSSISIPIQSPTSWPDELCTNIYMNASKAHLYHTSAILSAHIETATIPLRLIPAKDDIQSFCAQLDWRASFPFAELSGVFPQANTVELENRMYNFSSSTSRTTVAKTTRRDVTRGFSSESIISYDELCNRTGISGTIISSTHATAYPLPTSFPAFFSSPETWLPPTSRSGVLSRPRTTSVFSSIGATTGTAELFGNYARFLEGCARRKLSVDGSGIDSDEMGDLTNDLWTLCDNAGGDTDRNSDVDERGEDED